MTDTTARLSGKHILPVEDEYDIEEELAEAFAASGAVIRQEHAAWPARGRTQGRFARSTSRARPAPA